MNNNEICICSTCVLKEDAGERFERMQKELQQADMDSVSYRVAKIRSDRRVSFLNLYFKFKYFESLFSSEACL